MKAFRVRLEQAVSSGATLALLTLPLPGCGGSTLSGGTAGAPSASGAASAGKGGDNIGGGASTGEGGASTGEGGASTGEGGASTGEGGASTGEGGASAAGAAGATSQPLAPYPTSALGCTGPEHDGGYYGRCCAEALCYTPHDGSECVTPEAAPEKLGTFYGSGSCLCGGEEPIQGPFAKNPAHTPEQAGTCCYVISSITCEGRPLLVDGAPIISAPTRRCDWILADLLELLA
jgi:hypothetical protein